MRRRERGNYDSQSEGRCGEGREDLRGTTFMQRISKFNDLEARKSDVISPHTVDSTKSTIPKFSYQFKVSTNERRSLQ